MAYTLHTSPGNANAYKALVAAEYVGIKISVAPFEFGVTNKSPEFLKINPSGKIPALETPEGPVWESNAIARYVVRLTDSALLGATSYEEALVDQWIDFATTEIDANFGRWYYPLRGFLPRVPEMEEFSINSMKRALTTLNKHLATRTFVVGNSVTLGDIILGCMLSKGFRTVFTKEFTSEFPHVERYFWTLLNQPHFKAVFGEVAQLDQDPAKIPLPVLSPQQPKAVETPAVVEKSLPPKEDIVEKSLPPKKDTPKPSVDDEDEAPKPKVKNPLDLLPPSPFVIDNWKRLYSNTKAKDFAEVAIKGFWEMFDSEGWSFWFCDYKYNEENDKTYVTMNKVGGFLQRLDFIRKYAFGKMLILGEQPPFKIKGVWLFRGQDIPKQVLDECYDVELYEWSKADLSSEVQKARINAYFEEPDFVDGDKLLEAKCFK